MDSLQILSLGQAAVRINGQPVQWHSTSARKLFFYLLSKQTSQNRDAILETLWGLEVNALNSNRFRVNVHRVRMALGGRDTVIEQHGNYRLSPAVLAASDIHAFYSELERAKHISDFEPRLLAFRRALAFYQGHYLAFEPFEHSDWVVQTRAELQAAYTRAEIELSLMYCEQSNCRASVGSLSRALQVDALLGENYHQKLMACLSVVEDQHAAKEHYRAFAKALREKINDVPMFETLELIEQIKNGKRICQRQANIPNTSPTHNCPFVSDLAAMDTTASDIFDANLLLPIYQTSIELETVKTR
jgi:two-component SAPR family response regulator